MILGLVSIIAGAYALVSPLHGSLTLERGVAIAALGSLIPLGGMFINSKDSGEKFLAGVGALLAMAIGSFLLMWPEAGVALIGIVIGAWFLIHGLFKIVMSFKLESDVDRGFAILTGSINLIAALMIAKFFEDGNYLTGALAAGLGLVFSGIVWLRMARQSGKGVAN